MAKRLLKLNGKTYQLDVIVSNSPQKLMVFRSICGSVQISASENPRASTKFKLRINSKRDQYGGFFITGTRCNGTECISVENGQICFDKEALHLFKDLIILLHQGGLIIDDIAEDFIETVSLEPAGTDRQKRNEKSFILIMDVDGKTNTITNESVFQCSAAENVCV